MVVQRLLKIWVFRAVLVPYVAEHPDHDYFETLDTNEQLINDWHQRENDHHFCMGWPRTHVCAIPAAMKRIIRALQQYRVPHSTAMKAGSMFRDH